MTRPHARPRWLLLLLWAAVGAFFVASARPVAPPAHDEASPPVLSRAVADTAASPDDQNLPAQATTATPGPPEWPERAIGADRSRAGPLVRAVAFSLLRRPPPVSVSA